MGKTSKGAAVGTEEEMKVYIHTHTTMILVGGGTEGAMKRQRTIREGRACDCPQYTARSIFSPLSFAYAHTKQQNEGGKERAQTRAHTKGNRERLLWQINNEKRMFEKN